MGFTDDCCYGVAVGRATGVFTSWDDAFQQVCDYKDGVWSIFDCAADAQAFLGKHRLVLDQSPEKLDDELWVQARKPGALVLLGKGDVVWRLVTAEQFASDWYYAIVVGDGVGVLTEWERGEGLVCGYESSVWERSLLLEEAKSFVATHEIQRPEGVTETKAVADVNVMHAQRGEDPDPNRRDTLVAFCDGRALRNGQPDCQAAYPCVLLHERSWDVVGIICGERATNNRAESLTALEALRRVDQDGPKADRVLFVFTDSALLVNFVTKCVQKWKRNSWYKANGKRVRNADLLQQMLDVQSHRRVLWRHVRAHTTNTNWESRWNDVVDRMARSADSNATLFRHVPGVKAKIKSIRPTTKWMMMPITNCTRDCHARRENGGKPRKGRRGQSSQRPLPDVLHGCRYRITGVFTKCSNGHRQVSGYEGGAWDALAL